jgi:hypothetical protein
VFTQVADPVGSGFVASLPRPGGNVTGFINLEASMGGKWLVQCRLKLLHLLELVGSRPCALPRLAFTLN